MILKLIGIKFSIFELEELIKTYKEQLEVLNE